MCKRKNAINQAMTLRGKKQNPLLRRGRCLESRSLAIKKASFLLKTASFDVFLCYDELESPFRTSAPFSLDLRKKSLLPARPKRPPWKSKPLPLEKDLRATQTVSIALCVFGVERFRSANGLILWLTLGKRFLFKILIALHGVMW